MIVRLALLFAVLAVSFAAVAVVERRRRRADGLRPGVTVITGSGCTLCVPTVAALRGRGVDAYIVDVATAPPRLGPIRSLPAVYVVAAGGELLLRRSGRSALLDADAIAAAASGTRRSAELL